MARMRLQYDEARKQIQMIQQQLADLEEKVTPGQAESDKDRYVKEFVDIFNKYNTGYY
jgi:protein KIBRA